MNKKIGFILAIVVIAVAIWFIEFRETGVVVTPEGTAIETGVIEMTEKSGKKHRRHSTRLETANI